MVEEAKYDAHVRNQMTARNREVQTLKLAYVACISICVTRSERQGSGSYLGSLQVLIFQGCAMAHAVSHQRLFAEARIQSQVHPCRICGGRKGH